MTAAVVEAVDQAADIEIVDEDEGLLRVRVPVMAVEDLDTSDGRYLAPNGEIISRAVPMSILAQPFASHGGQEPPPAVVVGRLDTVERVPGPQVVSKMTGLPFPEGSFVWVGHGVVDPAIDVHGLNIGNLLRRRFLNGVSVDLAGMDYEIVGEDGLAADPEHPRRELITHSAEIAALTLVPIPAFADAYIELVGDAEPFTQVAPEELPEGFCASAFPAWRSHEVGDYPEPVPVLTAAADEGMPVRIPPDSVEQLTAVIDSGEERDATELATAIVEHIAQSWALDDPVTEDELPAEDGLVAAASEEQGGFPEDPQPCQYGPEPAAESLVFRDGDAYVPTCAEHRQRADQELAAAGEEVVEVVPIEVPAEAVTAAADEPHTGGMIALVPVDPGALVVEGGDPAEELHLTLAYLGEDVTAWDEVQRAAVLEGAQQIADQLGAPVEAEVMGHAAFNPTGAHDREPCAVYLVSGDALPRLKSEVSAFDASEHPVFLPHITAGYGLEPGVLNYVGPVVFDRLRVALGDDVHDIRLGEPATPIEEAPGEIIAAVQAAPVSLDPARQEPAVTAAAAVRPPADWFTDPHLDEPTALRVTESGRVYGHAALWDTVHIGQPNARIRPPRSTTGYAYYRTGAVLCDDGSEVAVGPITIDCGHAGTDLGRMATIRHYDDVGTAVADVAVGEDEHGIWVAGALRATVDEVTAARLRASSLSGDWRRVGSSLELCALLAVNVPGFPIPRARVASGEPMALVAAGALLPEEAPQSAGAVVLDYDTLADALAARLDARREAGELSARHAALVAELDDTPAVVAALLAEVDDSPQRAEALFAELDHEGGDFLSGMPPQLKAEWLGGAIAARIAWGTPGQFARCQAVAREKDVPAGQIDGMCADLVREATGREPGDRD